MIRRTFLGGLFSAIGLIKIAKPNDIVSQIEEYLKSEGEQLHNSDLYYVQPQWNKFPLTAHFCSRMWKRKSEDFSIKPSEIKSLEHFISQRAEIKENAIFNLTCGNQISRDIKEIVYINTYSKEKDTIRCSCCVFANIPKSVPKNNITYISNRPNNLIIYPQPPVFYT